MAFDKVDVDDDRRISEEEFVKAGGIMEKWGIKGDFFALFKEADADGKGMVLFSEFCSWAIKKNLDLDTDDDAL